MFFVATPDTQLFTISTSKATENKLNNFQTRNLQDRELWVCLNIPYWKGDFNLLLLWMFIWKPQNKIDPFILSRIAIIHWFKVLLTFPGSSRKDSLDKTESIHYSYGCVPICKIAFSCVKSLKYYLEAL